MHAQIDRIAYAHTSFFTTEPAEALADHLIARAPAGMSHVYLVSGGSEAIEAALKLARQYFVEIGRALFGFVTASPRVAFAAGISAGLVPSHSCLFTKLDVGRRAHTQGGVHADDTKMLYRYLKELEGICASHTSATSMGTDWRDNDKAVEPIVEIYQGDRDSYEYPDAPRAGHDPKGNVKPASIGGWEPKGFINLALLKGYKFSFESSSDHGSTHISYGLVYAEGHGRAAMLDAMKKRHTYAATDNIIADYRCKTGGKEYMMGDAFTSARRPTLEVTVQGTAPIARVHVIRDNKYVYSTEPKKRKPGWAAVFS